MPKTLRIDGGDFWGCGVTLKKNLKVGPSQKERIVFQPSIFRCELLVSGRGS